jgi:hypothetical protein
MKGCTRRRSLQIIVGFLGLPIVPSELAYSSAKAQPPRATGPDLVVVGGWLVERRDLGTGSPGQTSG